MDPGQPSISSTEARPPKAAPPSIPEGHLIVAVLRRPHGLAGEIGAELIGENSARFDPGSVLWLTPPKARDEAPAAESAPSASTQVHVEASRKHGVGWLLEIEGVETRSDAEALRGSVLSIPQSESEPIPGQVWLKDLPGFEVVSVGGEHLGIVTDVLEYPAQDILEIETSSGVKLLPFVEPLVPSVDAEARRLVVDAPAGVFDAPDLGDDGGREARAPQEGGEA